jgi:hypothetical protein
MKIHQYKKQTTQKINKRTMARTIPGEKKRGRPKKGQKMHNPKGPKKGKNYSPVVRSYFTHGPSYVNNMQIMRSNNSGRSRTSIAYQCNLLLYSRS